MRSRQIACIAVLVALAVTVGFLVYAGQFSSAHGHGSATKGGLSFVLLTVWVAAPYVGALLVLRSIKKQRVAERIAFTATLLVCAFGPTLVVAAVMGLGGAQGGLGSLFLPLFQWIAVGVISIVLAVVRQRRPV